MVVQQVLFVTNCCATNTASVISFRMRLRRRRRLALGYVVDVVDRVAYQQIRVVKGGVKIFTNISDVRQFQIYVKILVSTESKRACKHAQKSILNELCSLWICDGAAAACHNRTGTSQVNSHLIFKLTLLVLQVVKTAERANAARFRTTILEKTEYEFTPKQRTRLSHGRENFNPIVEKRSARFAKRLLFEMHSIRSAPCEKCSY